MDRPGPPDKNPRNGARIMAHFPRNAELFDDEGIARMTPEMRERYGIDPELAARVDTWAATVDWTARAAERRARSERIARNLRAKLARA